MKCRLICKTNVLLVIAALFWSGSTRVFAQAGYDDTDYSYVDSEEQIESGVKIAPLIAGSLLHNDYYAGEVHVGLDCLFTGVLDPFYFGIGLRGDLGFPRDGFPFRYVVGEETLDSPSLVGGTFYVPLGVSFSPFSNDKISFFIEAKGGVDKDAGVRIFIAHTANSEYKLSEAEMSPAFYKYIQGQILFPS